MKKNTKARVYKRISTIRNMLRENQNRERVDRFLEKYYQCELACKEIITDYRATTKNADKEIRIIVKTVRASINHIGINASDTLLSNLFSAKDTRGQCSAKKLRNAIVHDLSKEDIREVSRRFYELDAYLSEFLRLFDVEV